MKAENVAGRESFRTVGWNFVTALSLLHETILKIAPLQVRAPRSLPSFHCQNVSLNRTVEAQGI